MRIMASNSKSGKEINRNKTIFHIGYSIIFFLVPKESKNRNIKKVRYGKNMIIPAKA
jgi:hypothetical protein